MKTDTTWLHRSAILVAFCALIAIAAGAIVTSLYRPIAANGAISINPAFEFWHHIVGGVAVVLMLALAIALRKRYPPLPMVAAR